MSAGKPLPRANDTTRPYWDAVQAGRLLLQRCRACANFIHYPRAWCPRCWKTDLEWVESRGTGRVVTFTIVHQAPLESYAGDVPYVLAVIRLDEGPQMMTNVVGVKPSGVRVDLRVEVVFEERAGGFRVPQFRPITAGGEESR
ncbi:MAG TPA: Zn-ribbon domain-containing OB-fold protein [Candidatus Binatia bacterium]|nr:Zn-ribbon domain-containing OB-fold protein [Candidatus Binatia bacterium]